MTGEERQAMRIWNSEKARGSRERVGQEKQQTLEARKREGGKAAGRTRKDKQRRRGRGEGKGRAMAEKQGP